MSEALLDAPPAPQVDSAPPAAGGDFNQLLKQEVAPDGSGRPMPDGMQESNQEQEPAKKPDKPAEKVKPKTKWDVDLKNDPKPDDKAADAPADKAPVEGDTPPVGEDGKPLSKWRELKTKSDSYDILKDEAPRKYAEYEKTINELKAKIVSDEERGELETMRQRFAEERMENDPAFLKEVAQPINEAMGSIRDVAKEAGLDPTQSQALDNAIMERSEVSRSRAIRKIIAGGTQMENGEKIPLGDDDVNTLATLAIQTANALHKQHWPKEVEYRQKARDISNGIKGQEGAKAKAEQERTAAEYKTAHDEMYQTLSSNLSMLFDDPEVADSVKNAKPAETPMERAAQAQALELLAPLAIRYKDSLAKIKELEASIKARGNANPSLNGAGTTPQGGDTHEMSFRDALNADYRRR